MQEVPLIDLCQFPKKTRSGRKALGEALFEGLASAYGFVRIVNHGIGGPHPTIEMVYQRMERYFAQPDEVKRAHVSRNAGAQAGYAPFGVEHAKDSAKRDLKEFFMVGQELPMGHPFLDDGLYERNVWPAEMPDLKLVCMRLFGETEWLASTLLRSLSLALVDDEEWLPSMTLWGDTKMRLIHYPSLEECRRKLPDAIIDGEVRSAPHEDINLITILPAATSSGLQIRTRTGEWLPVHASGREVVVNVGDMLSRITNNMLPSTTHRVVNPDDAREARYSIPTFVHPRPRVNLAVHPKLCALDVPPPILSRTFLYQRLKAIGLLPAEFDETAWERA